MAGSLVPHAIVLAFGAGALGGADALRLLRQLAGRSPAVDLALCFVVISLLTAPILGTMLLARFVRKARAGGGGGGGGAPATELFAQVTAAVSVGAAFLVTACLLVVPGSGGLGGGLRLPINFVINNPVVVTVLAICAAAAGCSLPCAAHLRAHLFRGAGSAGGPTPAASATKMKVAIVLAFGAGALGGADALRLLFRLEGRSAALDLATCFVVISLLTAPLLGTMLLARFVRKEGPAGGAAPATGLFAYMTATVSVGAALLVVPGGAVHLPIDFAVVRNPVVVTVLVVCVTFAAAAAGFLPCVAPLRRFFRETGSAGGPAPAAAATKMKVAVFLAAMSSLAAMFVGSGGFDAHAPLLFHWRRSMVTVPVGVAIAIATVAGTMLLVRCSGMARNTAGAGGGGAAAPTS